jgi:hypothetical protein
VDSECSREEVAMVGVEKEEEREVGMVRGREEKGLGSGIHREEGKLELE